MRRVLFALALLTFATGCASGFRRHVAVPKDPRVTAIAIYPFAFRWPEPAYRSFELSQRMIDAMLQDETTGRALLFGPSDLRVYRAEDDNAFAASTLTTLLPTFRLKPAEVLVLRPWAEKRVQTSHQTLLDANGRAVRAAATEDVTFVGHVEILHPATRTRWVELTGEVRSDPFAERTDEGADPAPELTSLMQQLTREAIDLVRDQLVPVGEAAPDEGFRFAVSPRAALAWSDSGRSTGEMELARMDALDAELFQRARARFANPLLESAQLDAVVGRPAGLYVLKAPEGVALNPGDVVVQVNGEQALPHTFVRARRISGPDLLRVRRAHGDFQDVHLP